ncbi:ubiquitin carboxyl-terminal hydrolase 21-like isoform X2 [Aristolochia californica]|uniref:ubiquitin carboxyl-terminal hydrolase 21-like isoform X2 n=1 Tax=Aristolochia californica TaxID=171875 RepID=UPI0035D8A5BB
MLVLDSSTVNSLHCRQLNLRNRDTAMNQSGDSESPGLTPTKLEFADEYEFEAMNQNPDMSDLTNQSVEADASRIIKTSARFDETSESIRSSVFPHQEYAETPRTEDPPMSSSFVGAGLVNLGSQGGFCIICALRDHIERSLASSGGIVKPESLVQNLNHISPTFVKYRQEDAHEFLQCMLDRLHLHCTDLIMQEQEQPSKESFVKQLFGGCLKSQVRCCNCGHCSDTYEPLIDISLEVEEAHSLWNAFELFTKVEKIDMFCCESCKMKVSVEKQLTLDRLPVISILHFKRFNTVESYVEKLSKFVSFPLELDMRPFHSSRDETHEELKYDLYAVVVHEGVYSGFGHYISFIRSSEHCWFQLDDEKVTQVSEELVLSQQAYILFYVKQGSPSFASLKALPWKCPESSMHAAVSNSVSDERKMDTGYDSEQPPTISSGQYALDDSEDWNLTPPTPIRCPSLEMVAKVPWDLGKPRKPIATPLDMPAKALNRYMKGMPTSRRQCFMKYIPSRKCRSEGTENKRQRVFSQTGHPYSATRGFTM